MTSAVRGQARKIFDSRWPKDYFAGMDFKFDLTKEMEESTKHVFECAHEIRKVPDSDLLLVKVIEGKTEFKQKEFAIAKELSDKITSEDLESGQLKHWQLRIMKEPEGLVYWKPSELEAIMKNPKDMKLEETYNLGTADDMRRAAEFTVRE